jgi:threonylcarbamoyladenosine tRNA methylthiotransferase MtaB
MPQVGKPTIRRRAAELREIVAQERTTWLRSLVGRPQAVLAESDGTGHAPNFARVTVPAGTRRGSVVTVTPATLVEGLLQ